MRDDTPIAYNQILSLAKAGAAVIHFVSHEWERVRGIGVGLARELNAPLQIWNQSEGVVEGVSRNPDMTDALALLEHIRADDAPGVWLLEDFHPFLREEHHPVLHRVKLLSRLPHTPKKLILLVTPSSYLPAELRKEVPTVELALPDRDTLKQALAGVADELAIASTFDDSLIEAARGLTVMEARLAFGQAGVELGNLGPAAVPAVVREKERIIKQGEVLEYYPAEIGMKDVGGLDRLKDWLVKRGHAFGAGAREYGLDTPKGVLLLGVQGCGKSLLAKAVASTWQFPLLRLDLGKVFGGIVGQSEGNVRQALQVAQALAPCVLWIDELEKGLAGMGSSDRTDGGTTARVVGTLLTWMQEKREPVFVVATANRIDMLPPELLRKGRFDEIFFVDLPAAEERRKILGIHLAKRGRQAADFNLEELVNLSRGFSGAEIEEAVKEGLYEAFSEGREITTEHIGRALEKTYPLSRTMRDQIESLRRWAAARARMAGSVETEPLPPENKSGAVPTLRQEAARNPFVPGK